MPFVLDYSPVAALGSLAASSGRAQGAGEGYQRHLDFQRDLDLQSNQINQQNRLAEMQGRLTLREQDINRDLGQEELRRRYPGPGQQADLAYQEAMATEAGRRAAGEPYERAEHQRTLEEISARGEGVSAQAMARENAEYQAVRQYFHETQGAEQGEAMYRQWMDQTLRHKSGADRGDSGPTGQLAEMAYEAALQGRFLSPRDISFDPEKQAFVRHGVQTALNAMTAEQLQQVLPQITDPEIAEYAKGLLVTKGAVPANVRSAVPTVPPQQGGEARRAIDQTPDEELWDAIRQGAAGVTRMHGG